MKCYLCGEVMGTIYESHIGALCPKCEGKHREYLHLLERVKVPSHIPPEQRERYTSTIIGRQIENHNRQ
jgi:hypothetical protein